MMNGVMHSKGYYQVVGQAGVMFSYDMHCSSIEGGAPSLRRWWALRICAYAHCLATSLHCNPIGRRCMTEFELQDSSEIAACDPDILNRMVNDNRICVDQTDDMRS